MRVLARRVLAVGLVGGAATVAIAQEAPPIARFVPSAPNPAHVFVLDSAHVLSPQAVRALQDSARALQAETAADVAWVTLPTLGGRPIEEAALYIGRTWRIGSAGQAGDPLRNRGLVILFVPDKRTTAGSNFRVEVGNGLEGTITDSRSRSISLAMREKLRAHRYDDAYMAGWGVAAALVRADFASHGDAGRGSNGRGDTRNVPSLARRGRFQHGPGAPRQAQRSVTRADFRIGAERERPCAPVPRSRGAIEPILRQRRRSGWSGSCRTGCPSAASRHASR